jgi:plastocyanin
MPTKIKRWASLSRSPAHGLVLAVVFVVLSALIHPARAEEVSIDNFTFNPPPLTVKVRATVTWHNGDDIPHTVASKTRLFKSKTLDTDDTFTFTFSEAGTYEYYCSLHPHMTGAIVVEAQ